jgi:superfamily I DNA and RNA helicase
MANTESTHEIIKRIDALGRELEQLKRDLLRRLKRETAPGSARPSLFGSVHGGDVTEEDIDKAQRALLRDLKEI